MSQYEFKHKSNYVAIRKILPREPKKRSSNDSGGYNEELKDEVMPLKERASSIPQSIQQHDSLQVNGGQVFNSSQNFSKSGSSSEARDNSNEPISDQQFYVENQGFRRKIMASHIDVPNDLEIKKQDIIDKLVKSDINDQPVIPLVQANDVSD